MINSLVRLLQNWVHQANCDELDEILDYNAFRQHRIEINRIRSWLGMRPLPVPVALYPQPKACLCSH